MRYPAAISGGRPSGRSPGAFSLRRGGLVLGILIVLSGCAALQQLAALRSVDFSLAGTSGSTLAGVSIESMRRFEDLSATDLLRLGSALASGRLPLETDVLVDAFNPEENGEARLLGLDWTLFLDGRETVSGRWNDERVLPPGRSIVVPVRVGLDLLEFFDGGIEELADLALAVAGAGEPRRIHLEALPSVQTPLGPIRYPRPIRIEYEVGAD